MRWFWLIIFASLGLVMLVCGLLVPAHLRAVDLSLIEKAGRGTRTVTQEGLALLGEDNFGAAQLVANVAREERVLEGERLAKLANDLSRIHANAQFLGCLDARLLGLLGGQAYAPTNGLQSFTEIVVRQENRRKVLDALGGSPLPAVQGLLACRALTNTVLLPPSRSASGQAFDTGVAICGLLIERVRLSPTLRDEIGALATEALRGGNPQRLEQVLMDFMSLGQRLNWGQLIALAAPVQDTETLRHLARQTRESGEQLPALFCANRLSGNPSAVTRYLMTYSQTGFKDLHSSLRFGAGGLNELLTRNQRLYRPQWLWRLASYNPFGAVYYFALDCCRQVPWLTLAVKWALYLASGVCIAAAFHAARLVPAWERPLQVRGFHVAREFLFALGFLFVVLLVSEPFLSQANQKVDLPFRLQLPMAGSAVRAGSHSVASSFMNQANLFIMLLFFVLQGLLYTACVVKLAEIRRQRVDPPVKLKLLENEDHLFDAGLYLGFLGTIVSFILFSLSVVHQFSLMVAYSATAFGIVFVSFFKIFHLRPMRRRLLLEADAESERAAAPGEPNPFATAP